MQELRDQEQQQLDAGIFRVIAADQFLLGLRQVEGQPGRLGEAGNQKDDEAQWLGEGEPEAGLGLMVHDHIELERAGCEHDPEQAEAKRNLIGDQLGTAAKATEEAVLVVAGPAAEQHAVDGNARKGEDPEHTHIEARSHQKGHRVGQAFDAQRRQHAAEGDRRKNCQRRCEQHQRGRVVEHLVNVAGGEVFLEDDLQAVSQRLAEAEEPDLGQRNANPIGSPSVLHPGGDPPLDQDEVGSGRHQPADQQADFDQGGNRLGRGQESVHRGWGGGRWAVGLGGGQLLQPQIDAGIR